MALAGKYEGEPAKDHIFGFNNVIAGNPFTQSVEDSLKEQWFAAGGSSDSILLLDMAIDILKAAENFDIAYSKGAEVYAQMHYDLKAATQIAKRAKDLGVFFIAVDQMVIGEPFMGLDNYNVSRLCGEAALEEIDKIFGGWENVDRVFHQYQPESGEVFGMRTFGAVDVLKAAFGDEADPNVEGSKSVLLHAAGMEEQTQKAMADVLSLYPNDEKIVAFCLNDQAAAGFQAAAEIAGRWDPENWILIAIGCDELGKELVRNGITKGSVATFPEKYGEYIIPAALAHMHGNPVPPDMFTENILITKENIDKYYPK